VPAVRATNDAPTRRLLYRPDTATALEERQHMATLQLAANDSLAASVDTVNLENRFGDI
jgi:hypothetical protein